MNRICLLVLVLGASKMVLAQGCSDAGFCTMGAMKPDQNFNRRVDFKLRSIGVQYYYGQTTLSPVVESATLELNFSVGNKSSIQIKAPYQRVTGILGENQGWGDVSLSYTATLFSRGSWVINGSIGGKIPTGNSRDRSTNGLTLPMYYQTTLGSYDIIAGLSLLSKKWLVTVGYQRALTANENDFTYGEWVMFRNQEYLGAYDVGIGLKRGADLMLRVERSFRYSNYSFNFGVLPIYRITSDKGIIRTNSIGGNIETTGLALSVLGGFTYHFNVSNSLKFIYGYKLVDRPTNPDGLTRDAVVNVTYEVRF